MPLFKLSRGDLGMQPKSYSRDSRAPSSGQEAGRLCGGKSWHALCLHDEKPAGEAVLKMISADMCAF